MKSPVRLERPSPRDEQRFLRAARASRRALRPWVVPPLTPEAWSDYLQKQKSPANEGFLIAEDRTDARVGVVNLNEMVRGSFQSAYLGYYAFEPFEGRGFMREALGLSRDDERIEDPERWPGLNLLGFVLMEGRGRLETEPAPAHRA